MAEKSLAKIRIEVIDTLLKKHKSNEDIVIQLRNGYIPNELTIEYTDLMSEYSKSVSLIPATDFEFSQYSNWFYLNDAKIIGNETRGSGYINPIVTKGSIEEFKNIQLPNAQNINFGLEAEEKSKVKTEMKKEIITEEDFFESKILEEENDTTLVKQVNYNEVISIEESLKKYNDSISEDEIKAWVYFKRKYGNPMRGYEKYYLKSQGDAQNVIVSKVSLSLKDQQFKDVKVVPANTTIGVKTKFKNEYDSETYIVVKNEFNELYYVPQSKIEEKSIGNQVDVSELENLVKRKALCYVDDEYTPIPMYLWGNLYDIKDNLIGKFDREQNKYVGGFIEKIEGKFGKEIADWHLSLVNDALKKKGELMFNNPDRSLRPFLSRDNTLSQTFKIKELNEVAGVNFESIYKQKRESVSRRSAEFREKYSSWDYDFNTEYTLFEAFEFWFDATINDTMLENTTKYNIKRLYIQEANYQKQNDETKEEIDAIKLTAKVEGEKLYNEFVSTCLIDSDMFLLNTLFNKQYNSVANVDLSKIPVAFEANKNVFSDSGFILKKVQRDGLAFMSATNGGCYAYGVGFGKTLCAIHTIAQVMKEGKVKRPLIAVPKPVYKNWVKEMFGFYSNGIDTSFQDFEGAKFISGALTGLNYKFNDWTNLTSEDIQNKEVEPYTITLVTYQGLEKIGYSPSLRAAFMEELTTILKGQNVGKDEDSKKTERETEILKQNIYSKIGLAESDTKIDVDVCGFDYLIVDEAHNFKNVFGSTALDEDVKDSWRIPRKNSTKRAIKLFLNSLYMQRKYNGHVVLLTATPFTNSPLEIYSMMSLVGYSYLKTYNIQNMQSFLSMFIETISEYTVDATNKIKVDTVIKSFQNKNILRDILYRHFDYQDNPALAGVSRPCKINFPNSKVNTYLQMSDTQIVAQGFVKQEVANYHPKTNRGAMGRALNWAKSNSISPYLVPNIEPYETLEEFVNESPKIRYTIDCINSVKEYAEDRGQNIAGQVIYMNRGKDIMPTIKDALNQFCGFRKKIKFGTEVVDEVEIVTSANSLADIERKEVIKDAFNKGFVKVIIGTSTIKEGVNLQENGAVLYDLDLDWNPTDFTQLEGRIHRQGNKFKYVRIVVPLVQNTLDSFINQKLDEKSKRIATIWDKTSINAQANSIEENAMIDPMEIKFALIDDKEELFGMKVGEDEKKLQKSIAIAKDKYESIFKIETSKNDYLYHKEELAPSVEDTLSRLQKYDSWLFRFKNEHQNMEQKDKDSLDKAITYTKDALALIVDYVDNGNVKSIAECNRQLNARNYDFKYDGTEYDYSDLSRKYTGETNYGGLNKLYSRHLSGMVVNYGDCKKFERNVLQSYGMSLTDDLSIIKDKFKQDLETAENSLEFTKTEEFKLKIMNEIEAELSKRAAMRGEVEDRVNEFAKTNNLLTYPFDKKDADNCEFPTEDSEYKSFNLVGNVGKFEVDNSDDVIRTKTKVVYKNEKPKITPLTEEAKAFVPSGQYGIIKTNIEFEDARVRVNEQVANCPKTYETEDLETEEKIAQLHYFRGQSDWYIIEKDREKEQLQAFGYVILNGDEQNAEFGYINIEELKKYAELDLYWTPVKMASLLGSDNVPEKNGRLDVVTEEVEWKEAIETLNMLITIGGKKKEIAEWKEAVGTLEMLLSLK
jgi:hypothetical protein